MSRPSQLDAWCSRGGSQGSLQSLGSPFARTKATRPNTMPASNSSSIAATVKSVALAGFMNGSLSCIAEVL